MPFDSDRLEDVRRALAGPIDAFRSALAATLEDIRGDVLTAGAGAGGARAEGVVLGRFAAGRIDLERFAAVMERSLDVEPPADGGDGMRLARETLIDLEARADDLLTVDVPAGSSLRDAVASALAGVGRAFGAARVTDRVRAGRYDLEVPAAELMGLPFARWSRTERLRAPPLVVRVAGSDLHADALAEFLDGSLRLVLLVTGPASPAPLARLVTPGTFVLQMVDDESLDLAALTALTAWDGPGIAAVLPDGAARFVHDPAAGRTPAERLTVDALPDAVPEQPIGGISTGQMADQLMHLSSLAAPPVAPKPAATGGQPVTEAPAGPADKLAAWLLGQADLTGTS